MFCANCGDETTEGNDFCAACEQEQLPGLGSAPDLPGMPAGDAVAAITPGLATTVAAQSGWYVDPSAPTRERYWDGSAWTVARYGANAFTSAPGKYLAHVTLKGMSFTEAVRSVLTKYVGFSGRARRSEYWWFSLINLIPYVGPLVLLVFMCQDSGKGPNRYGPSPKYV